jgi:ribokinase
LGFRGERQVAVVGSLHVDLVLRAERLPSTGETVMGKEMVTAPGGKGLNQAVGLARLGCKSFMIGMVGDDFFGRWLIERGRERGVSMDGVGTAQGTPTGTALIVVDSKGRNIIAVHPGADEKLDASHVRSFADAIRSSTALLAQFEVPRDAVEEALRIARGSGVMTVLNPAPFRRTHADLISEADYVVPNEVEASQLTGIKVRSVGDAVRAGRAIVRSGARAAVITLGRRGSLLVNETGSFHVRAFRVKAVDTTGAGDAFCAALAFALISGIPKVEALTFANAAAAITTTRLGAQEAMPTLEEVLELAGRRANGARLRDLLSKTPGGHSGALSGEGDLSADL